jgi:parallel beta-helix repeat protein
VSNSHDVRLDTNSVTRNGVDGIGIGGSQRILVTANYVAENARVGVDISAFSDGNTLADNVVSDNGGTGIAVFNGNDNIIRGNAVTGNFDGILLSAAVTGSSVLGNSVNGNSNAGIALVATTVENTVKGNTAMGNGVVDVTDLNAGCNANTWRNNFFLTSNQTCIK